MNKQEALDLFERTRMEFLMNCRWVAKRIASRKGSVTIDDVREEVTLPTGIDGRVFGAVFNKSEWDKVGYTQTKRKSSHGRPIAVFRLKRKPLPRIDGRMVLGSTNLGRLSGEQLAF